jgi:hypothetical protein
MAMGMDGHFAKQKKTGKISFSQNPISVPILPILGIVPNLPTWHRPHLTIQNRATTASKAMMIPSYLGCLSKDKETVVVMMMLSWHGRAGQCSAVQATHTQQRQQHHHR